MANGNLNRRLDRLEASMPPRNQRALKLPSHALVDPTGPSRCTFLNRAGGDDLGNRTAPAGRGGSLLDRGRRGAKLQVEFSRPCKIYATVLLSKSRQIALVGAAAKGHQVLRRKAPWRPARIDIQGDLHQVAEQVRESAGFHNSTQVVLVAGDADLRTAADGSVNKHQRAAFTDLLKVSRHQRATSAKDRDQL